MLDALNVLLPTLAIPFPDLRPEIFSLGPFDVGSMTIGPFALRWYALAYIAGLALGWWLLLDMAKKPALWGGTPPYSAPQADDFILYATLGVIFGGRLGYVLFYKPELLSDPMSILRVWEGGMSFHGGFLGVVIAIIAFAMSQKISILRLGDAVAAVAPLGLFFGRIANFINGELWGRPTDVPWAVIFPAAGPEGRHPSQLYEAVLEGLVLFVILRLAIYRFGSLKRPGLTSGLLVLGYAIFRSIVEQFREPDRFLSAMPFGLTMGTVLSVPMFIAGICLIVFALRKPAATKPA
jgi:phosphatidylglycerol---prolipoprotein diacylglyceryl transferase